MYYNIGMQKRVRYVVIKLMLNIILYYIAELTACTPLVNARVNSPQPRFGSLIRGSFFIEIKSFLTQTRVIWYNMPIFYLPIVRARVCVFSQGP